MQIFICTMLLLLPFIYILPNEKLTITLYFTKSLWPLSLILLFYFNALWLVPHFAVKAKNTLMVTGINILIIVVIATGLRIVGGIQHRLRIENSEKKHQPTSAFIKTTKEPPTFVCLMWIKDVFNMTVAASLAYFIVIAKQWRKTENERQEAVVALREAELKALRNQISPHFLLNTLNNIYTLTAFDKNKAQSSIIELSNMLRHILYESDEAFVPLTQEIKFIQSYINLMRLRIAPNVEISEKTEIPDPCYLVVAPMLFISLVENAFKHGISPVEKSFISISLHADSSKIELTVANSNHPKKNDHSGHGVGLANMEQRLKLMYSGKYSWQHGVQEETNTYISKITIYETELCNH